MLNIDTSIQYLKGITSKRAKSFSKLGINTLYDLLSFFPVSYQDRTKNISIKELLYNNSQGSIFVRIGHIHERKLSINLSVLDIKVFDDKSYGYLRFFRKTNLYSRINIFSYLKKIFINGYFAYIYGDAKIEYNSIIITATDYEILEDKNAIPLHFKKIIPIYSATEGLKQKVIREFIKTSLHFYSNLYPDLFRLIPTSYNLNLIQISDAIKKNTLPKINTRSRRGKKGFCLTRIFNFTNVSSTFKK